MKENLNEEIEELRKIKLSINDIKKNYQEINSNCTIKKDVRKMIDLLDKIYLEIFNNNNNLKLFRFYGDFYIPTIAKIINRYNNLIQKNIKTADAQKLLSNIEQTIKNLNEHFENKYNSFFDTEIMDLDAEIKVLLKELNNK